MFSETDWETEPAIEKIIGSIFDGTTVATPRNKNKSSKKKLKNKTDTTNDECINKKLQTDLKSASLSSPQTDLESLSLSKSKRRNRKKSQKSKNKYKNLENLKNIEKQNEGRKLDEPLHTSVTSEEIIKISGTPYGFESKKEIIELKENNKSIQKLVNDVVGNDEEGAQSSSELRMNCSKSSKNKKNKIAKQKCRTQEDQIGKCQTKFSKDTQILKTLTTKLDSEEKIETKLSHSIEQKQKRKFVESDDEKVSPKKIKLETERVKIAPKKLEMENSAAKIKIAPKNKKMEMENSPAKVKIAPKNKKIDMENLAGKVKIAPKKKKMDSEKVPGKVVSPVTTLKPTSIQKHPFNVEKLKNLLEVKEKSSPRGGSGANETGVVLQNQKQDKCTSKSLRDRMLAQLSSARFRYVNEQLYTLSSQEAVELFEKDSVAFDVYHEGYRNQVAKWPTNPVNLMVDYIKKRGSQVIVADFGCGEAKIARSVQNKVHSFDLIALNESVTVCDMAHVPLQSGSVDIAVFCLSLMGTNLIDYLCEANRVLKKQGTLLIAEVVSRFEKVGSFVRKLEKIGFTLHKKDVSNTMFVWFEFKKSNSSLDKAKLPKIVLAPCVYKKR